MEEINYRFLQWGYYHAKHPNYASFYQNRSPYTKNSPPLVDYSCLLVCLWSRKKA